MIVLGIETATARLGAAIWNDETGFLAERHEGTRLAHCELLTAFIQDLAKEAGIALDDLDAIAVSVGPGSFTGLRIGIATAMGLAWGLGKPGVRVDTLLALAAAAQADTPSLICPLIDAKRSETFAGLYRRGHELPEIIEEPSALPLASLADRLAARNEPILFTGPAAELFRETLVAKLGDRAFFTPPTLAEVSAGAVARVGALLAHEGKIVPPAGLEPVYLRRSDAELARDARACSPGK